MEDNQIRVTSGPTVATEVPRIELCSPKIALMSSYPAPLVQLHMEMGTLSVQLRLSEVQQGEALIGQGLESFVSLELDIESAGSIIGKTKPEQAH